MLSFRRPRPGARRRNSPTTRGLAGLGPIEALEPRVVLSQTYSNSFGLNPDFQTIDVGSQTALTAGGDSYIHTFNLTFSKDAGLPALTYNGAQLLGGTVHVPISGTIDGPAPNSQFHASDAFLDIIVDGDTASPAGVVSSFNDLGNINNGNDVVSFTHGILLPAGEVTHTVGVIFINTVTNQQSPLIPLGTLAVDTVAPGIAGVGPVSSPATAPVDSVPVTLSDPITPGTFDDRALSLTRDGASVPLTGAVTVTPVGNSTTNFTVNGLSAFTAAPGAYVLSVNAATLADPALNAGSGSMSASFTVAIPGPTIGLAPVATPRNSAVGTATVTFSGPVAASTFTAADVTLTRDGGGVPLSGLTIAPSAGTSGIFTVGGLAPFTAAQGAYLLTVNAAGVQDPAGDASVGSASSAFVVDTTPPTVASLGTIARTITAPLGAVPVVLSEPVVPSTFAASALTLTRNGVRIALAHVSVTPAAGSSTAFSIAGLGAYTGTSGNYVLTIKAAGLRDAVGNAGVGTASAAFAVKIAGPKLLKVGPIAATIAKPLGNVAVTLSRPTIASSFAASAISLTRNGVAVKLHGLKVTPVGKSTTAYVIAGLGAFTKLPGAYVLKINAAGLRDLAGNPGVGGLTSVHFKKK